MIPFKERNTVRGRKKMVDNKCVTLKVIVPLSSSSDTFYFLKQLLF